MPAMPDFDAQRLRPAVYHDWLNGMRGGEKCLEAVLALFPRAEVFTLFYEPENVSAALRRHPVHEHPIASLPGARRHYRKLIPLLPLVVGHWPRPSGFDFVLSMSHCAAKGFRTAGLPHLCYCFTPMRYVWDRYSDYFERPGAGFESHLMALLRRPLQAWDRGSSRSVDLMLTSAKFVQQRIRQTIAKESAVVPPFADLEFFTPDPAVPKEDFYLVVSSLVPYKKVEIAVRACAKLGRRLVVVGAGPERERLAREAGSRAEFRGWLPDEAIRDLYRRARAFLFPGVEDFGITPLEAMACGTPVLAYGAGGALETVVDLRSDAAGGTGLFFHRQDPVALAETLSDFEAMQSSFRPAALRAQSERFSRARFQTGVLQAVERLLAGGAPRA